jgi:hypothetical protein
MGAMLPDGGNPPGAYREMKPQSNAGPFLGGGYGGDVHLDASVPARHDDVPRMIERIVFKPSQGVAGMCNPRRMDGFVDIDSPNLRFDVDGQPIDPDNYAKCKLLQAKVDRVIAAYLAGRTLSGLGRIARERQDRNQRERCTHRGELAMHASLGRVRPRRR